MESCNVPKELNCTCIDALIIVSFFQRELMPTISFVEKFSNLKSLKLEYIILNSDGISMVSKLSLLEFISLNHCKMVNSHLKIFENCTTLQEIQLLYCDFSDKTSIKPPSQMKRFEIQAHHSFKAADTSDCTQLQHL